MEVRQRRRECDPRAGRAGGADALDRHRLRVARLADREVVARREVRHARDLDVGRVRGGRRGQGCRDGLVGPHQVRLAQRRRECQAGSRGDEVIASLMVVGKRGLERDAGARVDRALTDVVAVRERRREGDADRLQRDGIAGRVRVLQAVVERQRFAVDRRDPVDVMVAARPDREELAGRQPVGARDADLEIAGISCRGQRRAAPGTADARDRARLRHRTRADRDRVSLEEVGRARHLDVRSTRRRGHGPRSARRQHQRSWASTSVIGLRVPRRDPVGASREGVLPRRVVEPDGVPVAGRWR